jgi:hypothetical protein
MVKKKVRNKCLKKLTFKAGTVLILTKSFLTKISSKKPSQNNLGHDQRIEFFSFLHKYKKQYV